MLLAFNTKIYKIKVTMLIEINSVVWRDNTLTTIGHLSHENCVSAGLHATDTMWHACIIFSHTLLNTWAGRLVYTTREDICLLNISSSFETATVVKELNQEFSGKEDFNHLSCFSSKCFFTFSDRSTTHWENSSRKSFSSQLQLLTPNSQGKRVLKMPYLTITSAKTVQTPPEIEIYKMNTLKPHLI